MKKTETTRIPFPQELLKGEWDGIVYAITTIGMNEEEHNKAVDDEIERLEDEFDEKNHESVSLRLVKKEIVVKFTHWESMASLIQFRVRDSY